MSNCIYSSLSLNPLSASHHCSRRVRVLRLHSRQDLRALPGWLPRQRFDWHSAWLSALPLPEPEQLCSNCRDGTGGVHQLSERTDRWETDRPPQPALMVISQKWWGGQCLVSLRSKDWFLPAHSVINHLLGQFNGSFSRFCYDLIMPVSLMEGKWE